MDTPLRVVNGITAFERVYTGTRLVFEGCEPDGDEGEASVALILWTDGEAGRPLVAELSFRLEDKKERFSRGLSRSARSFFEGVQRLDRARPEGTTKTEFIYRDADGGRGRWLRLQPKSTSRREKSSTRPSGPPARRTNRQTSSGSFGPGEEVR